MNKYRGSDDSPFISVSNEVRSAFNQARSTLKIPSEKRLCLQHLSSNYEEGKDRNPPKAPETCEWVLQDENFLSWYRAAHDVMMVMADSGCGKSVLAAALVEEKQVTGSSDAIVCYYFFKEDGESTAEGSTALSSLLH